MRDHQVAFTRREPYLAYLAFLASSEVSPMAGMSYLDIARSARSQQSQHLRAAELPAPYFDCTPTECEKSEISEKRGADPVLTKAKAEDLKQAILDAVLVEPEVFDRRRYDLLMGRWLVHEAALAARGEAEACA